MKSFFEEIFTYQNEVNQDILKQIGELDKLASEKIMDLLSHCINAHKLWNYRILGKTEKVVFQTYSKEELVILDTQNFKDTLFICLKTDLNKQVNYKSTSGKAYYNTIQEVLTQVSQHFQYHRGQIVSALKKHNIQLKPTDYIYYRRKEV
tara:strand:+ start:295 stop:744 length:450 start_codon:yes stop_codon:yes gene_type:complete